MYVVVRYGARYLALTDGRRRTTTNVGEDGKKRLRETAA